MGDLSPLLARAKEAKVSTIVNICTDKNSLEQGLALAEREKWIFNAGATTPHDVEKEGGLYFPLFEAAARKKQLVAIGETGLDYHYKHSPVKTQQLFLRRYLALALACRLPVIFHCREAFADLFAITDSDYREGGKHGKAVVHCFTGTMKEAEEALERGWLISLSGIVTFKQSHALREVAKEAPLHQLLIETDTPYLAPQKWRGKKNEPSFLIETAALIASIKHLSLDEVARETTENARAFFQLGL